MLSIYKLIEELKDKKIAIDDVVTTFSSKKESHKSSWTYLLQSQLNYLNISADILTKNDNIHSYDVWLVALPMEFAGSYNLFGGAQDDTALRMQRLIDFKGSIYSINREMPDIGKFAESRMKSCSQIWSELDTERLSKICENTATLDLTLESDTFVLGDSHSVSAYKPGANISRNDGKTLFGVLKEGMQSYIPEGTKHLISYFGNIDIRHHLGRQKDPLFSAITLAEDYIKHLEELNIPKITVVALLPIEYEERRIPKTGWHKGTPFIGTQKVRTEIMIGFNQVARRLCEEKGWEFKEWPKHWYTTDPKEFANTYMEKPGSVHLSRKYYQYDFDNGEENKELKQKVLSLF